MLKKMGFDMRWVNLVMRCVSSVSDSILLNGEQGQNFTPERGLRQGYLARYPSFFSSVCRRAFSND